MTTAARRRTQWCLGVELFPIRDPHQYHLDALVSTGRPVPPIQSGFAQISPANQTAHRQRRSPPR
jgi:hypothetical protein